MSAANSASDTVLATSPLEEDIVKKLLLLLVLVALGAAVARKVRAA